MPNPKHETFDGTRFDDVWFGGSGNDVFGGYPAKFLPAGADRGLLSRFSTEILGQDEAALDVWPDKWGAYEPDLRQLPRDDDGNVIDFNAGADTFFGGSGRDLFWDYTGDNVGYLGSGHDVALVSGTAYGQGGHDVLIAGKAIGGGGRDFIMAPNARGSGGDDVIVARSSWSPDTDIDFRGGGGNDYLELRDTGHQLSDARIRGNSGDDEIYVQEASDAFIWGGSGADVVTLYDAKDAYVNLGGAGGGRGDGGAGDMGPGGDADILRINGNSSGVVLDVGANTGKKLVQFQNEGLADDPENFVLDMRGAGDGLAASYEGNVIRPMLELTTDSFVQVLIAAPFDFDVTTSAGILEELIDEGVLIA